MAKITLTRALAEIKSLKDRIESGTTSVFITTALGEGDQRRFAGNAAVPIADIEANIKSSFQSVNDLFTRFTKIKAALVKANASTEVTICGETMTIAEAIERKRQLPYEEAFIRHLQQNYVAANQAVVAATAKLDTAIETNLSQVFGADRTKVTQEQIDLISKSKRASMAPSLIDPLGIPAIIEKRSKALADFKLEVDFALSETNAKTEIEIDA